MPETMSHAPVPEPVLAPNQFELSAPRNGKGERLGTGAIFEHRLPMSAETVGSAIMKAITLATLPMEAPSSLAAHAEKRTGVSFITEQERVQFEARKHQGIRVPAVEQGSSAQSIQLTDADKQQTERALDATRSALRSVAAQADAAKPLSQDRNEGAKQPRETKKAQKPERETETITIRSVKDGHVIGSFIAPKNATSAELNRAAQAAGLDYEIRPSWTTLHGLGIHARDIRAALKKAWQATAPPEASQK